MPLPTFFNQLLRLIYRMIFLLAAEDRGLLHPPAAAAAVRTLYATGYGLSRLRDRAIRPAAWDVHDDLWDGLCILFAALARGEPRLGLPALDGLFAYGETPDLDEASLSNRALLKAVRGLAWLDGYGAPVPVNWRDMETEELGSVYESLLEFTPTLADDGRGFAFAGGLATRGNQRKTTGSYYTPDSLVQALLTSALDPVLDRVQAEAENPAEALLGVKVLDPACGSGHFLLAAGRHIAARVARLRSGGTASIEEYRHALRDVARACLHGVDRNPMAVELTKVALWIETVEPGKPLGFLDANIRPGDALLGVFDLDSLRLGIPDAAFKALAGDDRVVCRELNARNAAERRGQGALDFRGGGGRLPPAAPLARADQAWRAVPEDSPEQIAAKQFEAARADPKAYALQVACDLYVAAFLAPKPAGTETGVTSLVFTTAAVWQRATGGQVYPPMEGRGVDLARGALAFHWPLEFPDVMAAGGFDAALGNPPWDRIKLQEQEYFASRAPEVAAAANAAERGRMIQNLRRAPEGSRERALYQSFEMAKRTAEAATAYVRVAGDEGGRFPLTGRGDVNTFSLFAELFTSSISPQGRAGVTTQNAASPPLRAHARSQVLAHQRRPPVLLRCMLVGYARVSPLDRIAALQRQNGELRAAGAAKVYGEDASVGAPKRPVLAACLAALGEGDTLVVTSPDRLGTLAEFVTIIVTIQRRGVGVSVLSWGLDTWDWMDHTLKPRLETLGRVVAWDRALAAEIAREAAEAVKHRIGRRPIASSKKAEFSAS